ncbi:hypothetical protein NIES4071_49700 [Calothrix sp. NIES-4071]|nr:hypothetical protein NIES4071_49700 [Calothrix sp. NIES-4071]BAZ59277.1 hypothetical protein NIES4105_49640 [Calothrix sp. NIES-4105]
MNDERARIAIYAMRSSILQMPTNQALQILRAVPLNKVTVAKEVVRLLGELSDEEAYQELLSWNERDLHRDVRVAFLRALWNHLERDATWSILSGIASSSDEALAIVVGRLPTDRLSQNAQKKLLELLILLLNHPGSQVRLRVLQRCSYLPVNDPEQILLPKLLQTINSPLPSESSAAANAVFATYSGKFANIVTNAIKSIISNRRILNNTLESLALTVEWKRQQMLPTVRAILEVLQEDPLTTCLQIKLAVWTLPWNELATFFQQLALEGKIHPEALFTSVYNITSAARRNDANELIHLEELLAPSEDENLRRIALAALITQSKVQGWNDELKQRLYAFRNDPSPMVAEKAQFTILPDT